MPDPLRALVTFLPVPPADSNVRFLAQRLIEVQTGKTGTALTLANRAVAASVSLFKNGLRLAPSTDVYAGAYTVAGTAVTLSVAAVAGDVFVIEYNFQQG
jgi:hypothetical protein